MTTPRTLLAHEDRFAIQDLIALYGHTLLLPEREDRVLGRSMLFMTSQPRVVGTKAVVPARAAEEDRASLTMAGLYGDIYTRTADGWRFQSRRADVDFSLDPRFLQLA
jgi:hypothetical protein